MKNGITYIVPAYNASKTIEKCIKSFNGLENTYVVVIDDGSTDDTWNILTRLSEKYSNLDIERIDNSGPSEARNRGLEKVETEYVGFCDADDYFDHKNVFNMLDKQSDLNVFSFIYEGQHDYNDSSIFSEGKVFSAKQYLQEMNNNFYTLFYGVVWNKIYKTEIIKENNLVFSSNVRIGEDVVFNLEYIRIINRITIHTEPICHHIIHKNSISSNVNPLEYYNDTIYRLEKLKEVSDETGIQIMDDYYSRLSKELIAPVNYIVKNNRKKRAIVELKNIFSNRNTVESLNKYNGDNRIIQILAKYVKQKKWGKIYNQIYFVQLLKRLRSKKA